MPHRVRLLQLSTVGVLLYLFTRGRFEIAETLGYDVASLTGDWDLIPFTAIGITIVAALRRFVGGFVAAPFEAEAASTIAEIVTRFGQYAPATGAGGVAKLGGKVAGHFTGDEHIGQAVAIATDEIVRAVQNQSRPAELRALEERARWLGVAAVAARGDFFAGIAFYSVVFVWYAIAQGLMREVF